ncbi:hypothetical protein AX17_000869 [Amanita inopinata Kibby_2008]|nr:hypothetical protein AX17_000869 [Amanita inopinata Kibby_2008]
MVFEQWNGGLECAYALGVPKNKASPLFSIAGIEGNELLPTRLASKRWRIVYIAAEYEQLRQHLSSLDTVEEISAYVQERKAKVSEIIRHAEKCETWAKSQNEGRALERDRLREERKKAQLKALGWERDLAGIKYPDALEDHRLVKVPQRLTERIWANIQGPILDFMEEMRRKRIERENAEIVMRRKKTAMAVLRRYKNEHLPLEEIMPEAVDFCDMPPIKAIINQPLDAFVNEESFSHITPEFPKLFSTWRKKIFLELIGRLRESPKLELLFEDEDPEPDAHVEESSPVMDEDSIEKLKLASTVFNCSDCGPLSLFSFFNLTPARPLFYPEVLGHTCLTRRYGLRVSNNLVTDPSTDLRNSPLNRTKWSAHALRLNNRMRAIAEQIIRDSGLDPAEATTMDMDGLDNYYACLSCAQLRLMTPFFDVGEAPVYGWRDAVRHQSEVHDFESCDWYIMDEDEFSELRLDDDYENEDGDGEEELRQIWCCPRCCDTEDEREPMSLPAMLDHVVLQHQFFDDLTLNRDYFKCFDANSRPFCSPPKVVVPLT